MRSISQFMTPDVAVVSTQDNLRQAAQLMSEWDVDALPVCDGERLVGVLTERDIVVHGVTTGRSPEAVKVREIMSDEGLWCFADQTIGQVVQQMRDQQARSIPVINRDMQLVGIVALADIAPHASSRAASQDATAPPVPDKEHLPREVRLHRSATDQADGLF